MGFFTRFSLKNASAVVILCVLIIFAGIYSSLQLKQEEMPNISIPVIGIITVYPGAAPEDVRNKISNPIEDALSSVSEIQTVNTTSSESVSAVIAQFDYSAKMDDMAKKIEDALKTVSLPAEAAAPKVMRIDFGSFPVLNVSVSNNQLSYEDLDKKVRDIVVPALSGVSGVGQVQIMSGASQAVYIKLLPDKLKENNLTLQTVTQLLQANNVSFPAGSVTLNNFTEPIRISGNFSSLDELKQLRLPVMPDVQKSTQSIFTQVEGGMSTLGETAGKLGQGISDLSQAVNGEIQLLSTIQDLQAQLFGAQMTLSESSLVLKDPTSTDEQKSTAKLTIQQLTPKIPILQAAIGQAQAKLKEVQAKVQSQTSAGQTAATANGAAAGQTSGTPSSTAGSGTASAPGASLSALNTVALGDIAEVTVGTGQATSYSRTNGSPSVIIQILKNQDANTVNVSRDVLNKFDSIKSALPANTKIDTLLNQADSITESVHGLLNEGLLGALFAFLVILFFLRNFRTTIIASISIPLSIFITLAILNQLNITLNIVTLGALSVAVGRIVDDSIVVIENTYRHLQSGHVRDDSLVLLGTREVASAITSSTFTTVAVFLPMVFVGGIAGLIFKPFALTVTIALLSSLLVAMTVIPLLSKLLLLRERKPKANARTGAKTAAKTAADANGSRFHEGRLMRRYQGLLVWSLNHKLPVLIIAVVLFAASMFLFKLVGTSFMPEEKEKYVSINMTYPSGTDVDVINKKALDIEKVLDSEKGILLYQATIGSPDSSDISSRLSAKGDGSYLIRLNDDADVDQLVLDLRGRIKPDPGTQITVNQTNVSSTSGGGGLNNLELSINGDDFEKVKATASQLTIDLQSVKGLENISNNLVNSKPEIEINVDQAKAASYGLSAAQAGLAVRELLNDNSVTSVTVDNKSMDVLIGLKMPSVNGISDIGNILIQSPLGAQIKVSDIAKVKEASGPVSLFDINGKESARVTARITEKNTGAVSSDVQKLVNKMNIPAGVEVNLGGVTEMMSSTFRDLAYAMIAAIFVVFFVMLIALGQTIAPLAILFSLPLAVIGGLFALFITGLSLDLPSMIGALMLIGIVVTNAIVLVDRVQQRRKEGMPLREALMEAGKIRMRPILMTAVATIAALMPLALGFAKGSVMSQSLAVIVIGGLTTSTFLTLIIVPVAYEMLEWLKSKIMRTNTPSNIVG